MHAFFELWHETIKQHDSLRMDIGYTKTTDYCLQINNGYPCTFDNLIVNEQNCDIKLLLSKGHVKLCEYLLKEYGGY